MPCPRLSLAAQNVKQICERLNLGHLKNEEADLRACQYLETESTSFVRNTGYSLYRARTSTTGQILL